MNWAFHCEWTYIIFSIATYLIGFSWIFSFFKYETKGLSDFIVVILEVTIVMTLWAKNPINNV